MSNFSPYANFGYVSMIKETTEGTPITPTNYLRVLSEGIETTFSVSNVNEITGTRERNIRSVPNRVEISGPIEFFVEPKMIGHFLRGLFGVPTTQTLTSNVAYRHCFEVTNTPKTYTIDVKKADSPWAYRFYGCHITGLSFEQDDNKLKCTAEIMPRKAFISARVTSAVSSGTTLTVDQTAGLTTSDTISIISKTDGYTNVADLTISAIVSDTSLTVSTIGVSIAENDIVVIKKATPTYDQEKVLTWLGGSQVYSGDDIDNTTAINKENFSLNYQNEVEARYFGGFEESSRYPGDIIVKGYMATGQIDKFYESQSNIDKMRKNEKFGLRIVMQGETELESNSAVKASSTWGASNGFKIEASTAGKSGNDINVTIIINDSDTLQVTQTGNNIVIKLANATASNNTGTLIAAAVNALSLVDATAEGTGATQFTVAEDNANLGFKATGTNVVGRDATEKPYIQFDNACAKIDPYFPGGSEDDICMEEIPLTFYQDVETQIIPKKWSSRVFLVNNVSSY